MQISVDVTKADFSALQSRMSAAMLSWGRPWRTLFTLVPYLVIGALAVVAEVHIAVVLVAYLFFCLVLAPVAAWLHRRVKRTDPFLGPRLFTIAKEGLQETNENFEQLFRWHAISHLVHDGERIFVMLGTFGTVIPLRGLDPETRGRFVAELQSRIPTQRARAS